MKSWKTTTTGILMMLGGLLALFFTHPLTQEIILASATAILGGLGLVLAKDSNVTGGTTSQ